jgi:hypothetical protein
MINKIKTREEEKKILFTIATCPFWKKDIEGAVASQVLHNMTIHMIYCEEGISKKENM